MSRMRLSEGYLPAYIDLHTVKRMSKVAGKIAVVVKALDAMVSVENQLESGIDSVTNEDLRLGKLEMARFAKIIAKNARKAVVDLKLMKREIEAYKKELLNAAN